MDTHRILGLICFFLVLMMASNGAEGHFTTEELLNLFPVVVGNQDYLAVPSIQNNSCLNYVYFYFYYTLIGPDCTEIPVNKTIDFDTMLIVLTGLKVLKKDAFVSWSEVREINLSLNKNLTEIESGAFNGLNKLANLSIADNPVLRYFKEDTFKGLNSLKSLSILRNNIVRLAEFTPSLNGVYLPNLELLIFSHNDIVDISKDDFQPMNDSSVQTIKMEFCSIRSIEEGAFRPLRNLERLNLGQNDLNESECTKLVESLKADNPRVWDLGLGTNDVGRRPHKLFKSLASSNVTHLDLSGNRFGPLSNDIFPVMPEVVTLDLSDVKVGDLPPGVINHTLFPSLENLILARNRFGGLKNTMPIPGLKTLDLSYNTANRHLGTLFFITQETLALFSSLDTLILSGNYLETLDYGIFNNVTNLKKLYLRDTSIHIIDDYTFHQNDKLIYLDLSQNDFPKVTGMNKNTFAGLSGLLALDLSDCYINSISDPEVFTPLISLRHLSIRSNALVSFDPKTFLPLKQLKEIDLRVNLLTPWTSRLFPNVKNLTMALLDENRLTTLTPAMLEDFYNTTKLNLSRNPLNCDCTFYDNLLTHITSGGSRAVWRKRNVCFSPDEMLDLPLHEFWQRTLFDKSCVFMSLKMKLLITFSSLLLLVFFLTVIVWNWKWELLFFWLEIKQRLGMLRLKRKDKNWTGKDFKYDAFVSFSHQDKKFVQKLVAILEGEYKYHLCVYDRDFVAGDLICDSVIDNVASSRTTIMILSEAFVKSTWCQWELQIAQQRSIFFRKARPDSIIVVKLSEVEPDLMTDTLKYLIKTRIYLKWDPNVRKQRVFWHQLNAAISKYK